MNWEDEYRDLVLGIGTATYGKQRWFYQGDGMWYDREYCDYIATWELNNRITKEIEELENEW